MWHYASEKVRRKVHGRDIQDRQIDALLRSPDRVLTGHGGRRIAQGLRARPGFGEMLLRVVVDVKGDEQIVVTAYWSRPERYARRV